MTAAVLDASAGIELLLRRPAGACVEDELRSASGLVFVPELFDLEVASALRKLLLRRAVTVARAERALHMLATLPAARVPHRHLLDGVWRRRANMTVYDATYPAVAELVDGRVVTTDAKLAGAPGVGVPVVIC